MIYTSYFGKLKSLPKNIVPAADPSNDTLNQPKEE